MKKNVKRDVEKEIIDVLDRIRPYLEGDGGGLEYIKFEDGIVYVRLLGACQGCSLIDVTLKEGIEAMLMDEIPEVMGVTQI
ncbi:MAG: NifU family protein [Bacilli bacterium]|nr:NifU family protein [Bacilli bacterium]